MAQSGTVASGGSVDVVVAAYEQLRVYDAGGLVGTLSRQNAGGGWDVIDAIDHRTTGEARGWGGPATFRLALSAGAARYVVDGGAQGRTPAATYVQPSRVALAALVSSLIASGAVISNGSVFEAEGLAYRWQAGATAIPDMPNLLPAPGPFSIEHFGAVVAGDQTQAVARANAAIIMAAHAYAKTVMGDVSYPIGKTIYVDDHDADGTVLMFDGSYTRHRGINTVIQNIDPTKTLVRFGQAGTLTGSSSGRTWSTGIRVIGLTFDNGAAVQLCTNPSGEDGTITGWSKRGTATLSSSVNAKSQRCLRATFVAAGDGVAYPITTVVGKTYWVTLRVLSSSHPLAMICASSQTGLVGAISTPVDASTVTDPLGRVTFSFVAIGATSWILLRQPTSGATAGATLEFRDVYAFTSREEGEDGGAPCAYALGLNRCAFEDCEFRNSYGYAFGFQNGGATYNTFERCTFSDSYMDGLDYKNNGDISRGNKMVSCRFIRNSLKETVSNLSACCDLGYGWQLTDIYFEQLGCNAGAAGALRFKTGDVGDAIGRGTGGRHNTANGVTVRVLAVPRAGYAAYHAQHSDCLMGGLIAVGADTGILLEAPRNAVVGFNVSAADTGVRFGAKDGTVFSVQSSIADGYIDAKSYGIVTLPTQLNASCVHITSQGVGIQSSSGSWVGGLTMIGGSVTAPTAKAGSGTVTAIGVSGLT